MDELNFKESDLKFYFVVDDGIKSITDVSTDMKVAFWNIKEYFSDESAQWMQKGECLKITRGKLTKRHIFVLDKFSGEAFDYLQQSKSLIFGPRFLISCLAENASIPLEKSPVFTTAMGNLVLSASGLSALEKAKIQSLVSWMGGCYMDDLSPNCTHLVSNTVQSNKYKQAALNAIPIMHFDWVYTVWERNCKETISATSREFAKYHLPIFYNLKIMSTGLTGGRKNKVMNLVIEYGGTYQKSFKPGVTDIIITEKDKRDSNKFQVVVKYKKVRQLPCLLPDWIFDSVKKGYALPTKRYKVSRMKISTSKKSERNVSSISDFNPDSTQLSEISHIASGIANCTINEACASTATFNNTGSQQVVKPTVNKPPQKTYRALMEQINPSQAKKAGLFLEGCCVYLSGFTVAEKEHLNKILNTGGATHFDEICDTLTHIIVGELIPADFNSLKINAILVPILSLEWLIESIKQQHPAEEREFIYNAKFPICVEPEVVSLASKKTLESMKHSIKKPVASCSNSNSPDVEPTKEKDLLQQYLEQPSTSTASSELNSQFCTDDFASLDFFTGKTVYIHEHYHGLLSELTKYCEKAGAKLVNEKYPEEVDYVIVPSFASTDVESIPVKAKHIVNSLWLDDAMAENRLLEVEYFYAPISKAADSEPLVGLQVVTSLYSGNERTFIEILANVLGATNNDRYAKKKRPILICSSPKGAKYNAAIKWGYPAVTSQWLIECSTEGRRVEMDPYLVGETVAEDHFFLNRIRKTFSEPSGSDDKSGENSKEDIPENKPHQRTYNSDGENTPTSPTAAFKVSDFDSEGADNVFAEPPTSDFGTLEQNIQSCEESRGQSCEESRGQSCEKSMEQSCEESSGQTCEESMGQSCEESRGLSSEESGGQTCEESMEQSCEDGSGQSCEESMGQSCKEGRGQSCEESRGQSPQPAVEPDIMPSRAPESQALPATAEEQNDMIGCKDPSEFMPRWMSKMEPDCTKYLLNP